MMSINKNTLSKKNYILTKLLQACSYTLLTCCICFGSAKSWETVEESKYLDILGVISTQAKSNYEKITTWKGTLDIVETRNYRGNQMKKLLIEKSNPAAETKHIRHTVTAPTSFAINLIDNKLYSSVDPKAEFRAMDLNQDIIVDKVRYSKINAIITSQE